MNVDWTPGSWRGRPAAQQPDWGDDPRLDPARATLARLPPLVFAGETRSLAAHLTDVSEGRAFLLQAGDCAESFETCTADSIRERFRVLLQMAVVLAYSAGVPVVKVGRIAGQYGKPRSSATEMVDGVTLPSFRGQVVNDLAFDEESRRPDPDRLLAAYHHSAATLNLLRAFARGGFADLSRVHQWNVDFVASSPVGQQYERVAAEIDRALRFMAACGIDTAHVPSLHEVEIYTSHEALVLDYEEALTRTDSLTGEPYDCSAHMVWIGERTRDAAGAHVEFARGIRNPVGCKIGPTATPAEVTELCALLDPDHRPGRLTLIARMGAERVRTSLPPLIEAVREAGHKVVWACDPMHGNTYTSSNGRKTRHFEAILDEVRGFFETHNSLGSWPGGVHLELTGDNVTECVGGADELVDDDLERRYETMCDPRLNGRQGVELAFRIAELLRT